MRHRRPVGYEIILLAAAALLFFPSVLLSQTTIQRAAGTGTSVFNGDRGSANSINLNAPTFILLGPNGIQYLADSANNCVRRIDASGVITTLAGLVTADGNDTCDTSSNLKPTPAQGLLHPAGLAIDPSGRLYIADS